MVAIRELANNDGKSFLGAGPGSAMGLPEQAPPRARTPCTLAFADLVPLRAFRSKLACSGSGPGHEGRPGINWRRGRRRGQAKWMEI